MNDIEVLEEKNKSIKEYDTYRYDWTETDIQMVENLLKERQSDKERIKELEEINEAHKKENGELKENKDLQKSVDQIYEDYQDIGKMYFNLTEKIESKIEEINSRIEKYREYAERGIETDVEWVDNVADRETVKVLEELLKENR